MYVIFFISLFFPLFRWVVFKNKSNYFWYFTGSATSRCHSLTRSFLSWNYTCSWNPQMSLGPSSFLPPPIWMSRRRPQMAPHSPNVFRNVPTFRHRVSVENKENSKVVFFWYKSDQSIAKRLSCNFSSVNLFAPRRILTLGFIGKDWQ